ncbi:MAG: hypothetical protein HYZ40_16670 [Rhodospirillales bacterium]|nr:hypothetical protein [Rhodospirillales bacterium]
MTTFQDFRRTISHRIDVGRKRRQLRRELAQLATMGSLDAVLADVGLARSQVETLIAGCDGSRDLLDQMIARLGVDAARLPVDCLRDMTWTCTTCPNKRQCREWLFSIEETECRAFCPNAAQLDHELAKQRPAHA